MIFIGFIVPSVFPFYLLLGHPNYNFRLSLPLMNDDNIGRLPICTFPFGSQNLNVVIFHYTCICRTVCPYHFSLHFNPVWAHRPQRRTLTTPSRRRLSSLFASFGIHIVSSFFLHMWHNVLSRDFPIFAFAAFLLSDCV